jgi:carbon starvation protein
VPALIWIILGAIFVGAVHDSGALLASIRHRASSITQVVREHMSKPAYYTFLMFVWLSLIYVVIAFTDVTASTFSKVQQFTETTATSTTEYSINGGAVVVGAFAYLALSVALGLLLRFTKVPWWVGLIASCVLLTLTIVIGPAVADRLAGAGLTFMDASKWTGDDLTRKWDIALIVYCFLASIVPMWLLLQPRGAIGATFLYAILALGIGGAVVGAFTNGGSVLTVNMDTAFKGFVDTGGNWLFPFLFITIACGACSGFHSIVASGTTSKQVRKEGDVKPVAYGAMLLEAMVAIFSLACVMMLANGAKGNPDFIYAQGMAKFQSVLGIGYSFALLFALLAFSSFVFDTLDVCTRLGRYVFQELTGLKGTLGGALATFATLIGPAIYLYQSPSGSFRTFWVIFGTSNQLLAALTLVGVSVWLYRTGRPVWFALAPAIFMLLSTATALVINGINFYKKYVTPDKGNTLDLANLSIAIVLFLLGAFVVTEAVRAWQRGRPRQGFPVG